MNNSYKTTNFTPIPKGPHNEKMIRSAKSFAEGMKKNPSELEKKMIKFLTTMKCIMNFRR